ncbi:hypothetical protein DERF_014776 [Dermatophagoides farinae]|uniref:Uncharacterized protein n=1 Tax=Dermatophagoides farinae TaxID=6954 RepID=A0A922HJN2_DERFA|nr:hypothetical protein DERF_014776 [Dermatophagoides farinae]
MCHFKGSFVIGDPSFVMLYPRGWPCHDSGGSGVHRTRKAVADTVRTVTFDGGPCGNACNV